MVLWGLGLSTASVHHVAVLRYWTVAALGLTSFSGKGLLCGVERWSTSQPLQGVGTLPLQQETDKLVTLLSHLATAREQTHITENFGFGPHHTNRWQWSLMMGVRLFLGIQGTLWWGAERRANKTFRTSCPPCITP